MVMKRRTPAVGVSDGHLTGLLYHWHANSARPGPKCTITKNIPLSPDDFFYILAIDAYLQNPHNTTFFQSDLRVEQRRHMLD